MMYKVAELFTGTGAFSLAFKLVDETKYQTIYANDFEPSSKKIFDANHTEVSLDCRDLTQVDSKEIPSMDILTSGFPCQPFSIAGMQQGFDDPRANVFWKIIEVVRHHKPRIVILENVKNLQSHDKGNTFVTIQNSLEREGYQIKHKILNTAVYSGVPQNRERIYIVCFRDEEDYENFAFPEPFTGDVTNIASLLERDVMDKYYYTVNSAIWEKLESDVTENVADNAVYQYRRYYVRKNKSGLCPTLTANMGTGGHNVPIIKDSVGIRKLTPRECFNLQGFPSTYVLPNLSDAKLYKLAGNAVSVPVVASLIASLPI